MLWFWGPVFLTIHAPPCFPMPSLRAFVSNISDFMRRCGREGRGEPGPPLPWNSRWAGTPRSPGPVPLHVHLAPAGRWVRWPVLPACQLAPSTQWLAPRPLGWAAGPPHTGMQLAVRSRRAGRSGHWLCDKLPAGFAVPGALAPLGWHRGQEG